MFLKIQNFSISLLPLHHEDTPFEVVWKPSNFRIEEDRQIIQWKMLRILFNNWRNNFFF